jgi:PAS domain S-box-containing protein
MTQTEIEFDLHQHPHLFKHSSTGSDDGQTRKLLGAYDTLLDLFMPPSILVDERWMVLDTYAGADRYLRLRSRRPTKCVHELLCEPLRMAMQEAVDLLCRGEHPVVISPVDVSAEHGHESPLSLTISMVPVGDGESVYYAIYIEPVGSSSGVETTSRKPTPVATTARDASYSENDSQPLHDSVRESQCYGDESSSGELDQFLASTQLPVVFLDRELRIRRFTAPAAQMFNLVDHDLGREIRTFAGVLEVPDLIDRLRAVIFSGDPDEVEIQLHRSNQYLIAQIAPYRNGRREVTSEATGEGIDDIDGAILTLIDLSHLAERIQDVYRLSSIVQSADDAIISRDRDNRIMTWNAGAEEMFGYTAEEAVGRDVSLIIPVDQEMEHTQTFRMLQKGGRLDHFESVRRTKSGQLISVSVRLSPVYDDEHRVVGMSTIERDISRQCEVMNRLVTSERKFQDFYHQSPDIYCSLDASTGTIVDCNDRMCLRLGYDRSEIIGRSVTDFYSLATQENARVCFELFRLEGEVRDQELELVCRDGAIIPVSLNVTAIRDATGKIIRSRSVWRDMSSLKQKEEQVRQSELRYRNSFQNSAIGIAQVGLDGRYLMTNRRMAEIVGYSAEELSELRFSDITHPDDLVKETELRNALIEGRTETYMLEKRYRHKLGHDVWVSLFVSLERSLDGKPTSCHSYVEDITSRKALESELRLAISQRDQFLAMLSHELRNPLGAILNTCAVLSRGRGLPKTMQQPVSIVTRQARQMAELLDDLLDVSRITSGKIKLEKSPILLSEIVDEAVESQQGLASDRHQRLIVTYADEPLRIFGDRSRLVQVVVNLLNNAIKYSGEGGVIKVNLERKGRHGVIRVQDSGVGIEPDLIESLFEMFAQKDSTLDRSGGGMGLGLHLVRRLVEFHSGKVYGRSEGVGKGSEFVVELPLSNRLRTTASKDRFQAKKTERSTVERIVVVEDIDDARNMLVALLEADDYVVKSAADGQAGLELILQERPDLAIVDIGLPKLDGYQVARQIRQQIPRSELTLVALSGYGQDTDHDRAIAAGFDVHLVKPLNQARLEMILGRNSETPSASK